MSFFKRKSAEPASPPPPEKLRPVGHFVALRHAFPAKNGAFATTFLTNGGYDGAKGLQIEGHKDNKYLLSMPNEPHYKFTATESEIDQTATAALPQPSAP